MTRLDKFDGSIEAVSGVGIEKTSFEPNLLGLLRWALKIRYTDAYMQTICEPLETSSLSGDLIGRWRLISRQETISPVRPISLICDQYDDPEKPLPHCNITGTTCPNIAIAQQFQRLVANEIKENPPQRI